MLDFKDYVSQTSDRVKEAALAEAEEQQRPVVCLESSKTGKEDLAKKLLAEHPLDQPGLVCAFKVVEPCMSFEYHRSQAPKERGLKLRPRKCLHVYKYFVHPNFGFMNARIQTWSPSTCMRFLGKKAHGNYTGELTTSFKDRAEGIRVKHWAHGNSVKMYDKAGSILRVETTIAQTTDFKVLRPPHDNPDGALEWRPMRKGVADLHRRAELSQRSNERCRVAPAGFPARALTGAELGDFHHSALPSSSSCGAVYQNCTRTDACGSG